jgi:hypothetical protein
MFPLPTPPQILKTVAAQLHRGFDATTTWVTQLSWWKFFLFAAVALIAGSILQEELFSPSEDEDVVVENHKSSGKKADAGAPNVLIDDSGILFNFHNGKPRGANDASTPVAPAAPATPAPPAPPRTPDAKSETADAAANKEAVSQYAATGAAAAKESLSQFAKSVTPATSATAAGEVHIDLPPQISEQLSNAIEDEVDVRAEQKVSRYHKQASTWFKSFVSLLVLALFATKALVGGKKRAEAQTMTANAAAERESMQRQLSEAKMQMMQAQVEPHFLFNTLASVEHLIETNPPRASAMQRSLILYLRAVLPQMRDNALITNLGREADMVQAYLNLLKMRMEERLTVDFQIPEGLRSAAFPPMMLQSMVENAIKHGLECKPEGGTLKVMADVAHNKLRVTVIDDGVGFGVMPSDGTGLGLPTIRERLKLLHGTQGQLLITPNLPSGVCAVIEVPYELSK